MGANLRERQQPRQQRYKCADNTPEGKQAMVSQARRIRNEIKLLNQNGDGVVIFYGNTTLVDSKVSGNTYTV
jgi:hypothetical protein